MVLGAEETQPLDLQRAHIPTRAAISLSSAFLKLCFGLRQTSMLLQNFFVDTFQIEFYFVKQGGDSSADRQNTVVLHILTGKFH